VSTALSGNDATAAPKERTTKGRMPSPFLPCGLGDAQLRENALEMDAAANALAERDRRIEALEAENRKLRAAVG
jgi:hypothetical protein